MGLSQSYGSSGSGTAPQLGVCISQSVISLSRFLEGILVRVLQGNRTNRIHIDIQEKLIRGIGSSDHEGWGVPRSSAVKLENQESCDIIQSQSDGLRARGYWCKSGSPKAWEPGAPTVSGQRRCKSQLKKRETEFTLPLCFRSISGPQWMGWCPPTLGRVDVLYSVYWIKC